MILNSEAPVDGCVRQSSLPIRCVFALVNEGLTSIIRLKERLQSPLPTERNRSGVVLKDTRTSFSVSSEGNPRRGAAGSKYLKPFHARASVAAIDSPTLRPEVEPRGESGHFSHEVLEAGVDSEHRAAQVGVECVGSCRSKACHTGLRTGAPLRRAGRKKILAHTW